MQLPDSILNTPVTEAQATSVSADVLQQGKIENQNGLSSQPQEQPYTADLFAREKQSQTPEIAEKTKSTCADALVLQYSTLLDSQTIPPGSWYEDFQNLFEEQFKLTNPGKDPRKATPEDLKTFAVGLAQKDQFQTWGIKIAEDMQILMEGGFGAKNGVLTLPEKSGYVSDNFISDDEGNVDIAISSDLDSVKNTTPFPDRLLARLGLNPEVKKKLDDAKRTKEVIKQTQKEFLTEGNKQTQLINGIEFSSLVYNENFTINRAPLNDVQKTFLRKMSNVPNASEMQRTNLDQISNFMNNITAARRNFYAHQDRQLVSQKDFVFLKEVPGQPNEYEYNDRSNQPNVVLERLGFAVEKGTRPEVAVGISNTGVEGQLQIIQERLREELKTSYTETVESSHTQTTRDVIDAKIAELTAEKSKPMDEAAEKQLVKEITELQAQLATTLEVEAKEKEFDEEIQSQQGEKDKIESDNTILPADIMAYNDIISKRQELAKKERAVIAAEAYCKLIEARIAGLPRKKEVFKDFKDGKVSKETTVEGIDSESKENKDLLFAESKNANQALIDATNAKNITESESQNLESGLPPEKQRAIEQMNMIQAQIDQKKREKAQYRLQRQAKLKPGAVGGTFLDSKALQTQIEAKTNEKNGKRFNELFIQQQIDVNIELKDRMEQATQEAIQSRAMQSVDSIEATANLKLAEQMYPDVPVAYLRTLQILYGPEVTTLTANGKAMYEKATKLLPPERFIAELKNKDPVTFAAITNAYDTVHLALLIPQMLRAVDSSFVNSILSSLRAEGLNGTLGKVDQTTRNSIQTINSIKIAPDAYQVIFNAAPTAAEKALIEATVTRSMRDIYKYDSVDDLAFKIKTLNPGLADTIVKTYATEIDTRKKKI